MASLKQWIVKGITFLAGMGMLITLAPLFSNSFAPTLSGYEETSPIQTTRQQVAALVGDSKTVLKVYDNLMEVILQANQEEGSLSTADVQRICEAICFAAREHKLQTRKNAEKTPYISHPLEVTYDLVKIGQVRDVSVIIGAILHDTAGEKKGVLKEVNEQFGSKVASLVGEVSSHPVSAQEVHQRDLMVHASDQSVGTVQIELADLLCSLKELSTSPPAHWKKERVDHFFEWAQSVLDRFPDANKPLHDAVEATIQAYWDHQ